MVIKATPQLRALLGIAEPVNTREALAAGRNGHAYIASH
jgi:hypothetical protein